MAHDTNAAVIGLLYYLKIWLHLDAMNWKTPFYWGNRETLNLLLE